MPKSTEAGTYGRIAKVSRRAFAVTNKPIKKHFMEDFIMAFFQSAVGVLQTLVVALGIWGVINLMEGYGNDNPGAKSQGMKQLIPSLMEGI